MLVSHLKRFVFLKTIKTAATSVEIFLEPYCRDDHQVPTHSCSEHVGIYGIVGARGSDTNGARFYNHASAHHIKSEIGDGLWHDYLKITCIRNPFDKAISAFWMFSPLAVRGAPLCDIRSSFRQYVFEQGVPIDRDIYSLDGKPSADVYIRFESLARDLEHVCGRLDIPFLIDGLGRFKADLRPSQPTIDAYYDDETRIRVAELYAPELDHFGYSYPDT